MKYQRYEKYKDSGIEWLREIPAHWGINRISYSTYVKGRIGWQGLKSDEFIDEGPYLVTGTDFLNGSINWEKCYHISEERFNEDPNIHLKENDLLITKDGTIGKISIVKGIPAKTTLNSGIFVTRPLKSEYNTNFMYWVLNSNIFSNFIEFSKSGTTIAHLYQHVFEKFYFPVPSEIEQQSIARFLDRETSRIDALIERKQRLIELLREKRIALITKAVTKGLNPNVKMKDSGVEWIGEVPEHWKIVRLGHFAKWRSGDFLSNENFQKGKDEINIIPVIGGNGISGWTDKYLENRDLIVIGRVGALCGNVHFINYKSWITDNALYTFWHKSYDLEFLSHFLRFLNINRFSSQTAQPLITGTQLSSMKILLPPLKEQLEIVNFINTKSKDVDSLINKLIYSISKHREYRSALISAVVTGKIRVTEL